jgi:hypothetical protein
MNRRKFLKQSVGGIGSAILAAHPLELFLANVLSSLFQRAHAQSLDLYNHESFNEKKLISLSLAGGPSRWYWDLPLKPNGEDDPFSYGPSQEKSMLITKLNSAPNTPTGFLGEYETVQVGDYYFLPYLWSGKIATPNGGMEDMSKLAQNMLMIRGIHTINNHEVSRRNMLKPSNYASMGGLLADQAKTPVPAIATPGNETGSFKSRSGTPQLLSSLTDTPLEQLLNPFNNGLNLKLNNLINSNSDIDRAMDAALDIMRDKSRDKHRSLPTSYQDRIKAKQMMTKEYTKLTESFDFLSGKYTSLINRSFGDPALRLAGCDDLSITGVNDNPLFRIEEKSYYTENLLDITNGDTTILNLAEAMAVAEFMITGAAGSTNNFKSFSSFVNMTASSRIKNVTGTSNKTASADAHFVGSYTSLVLFSRYYRAIASCLYEFKNQLASKKVSASGDTLFDRSVLTISSEFSRDARDDGSGSDHGYQGAAFSILSGMIDKTMVFGDIKEHSEVSGKNCTWGYGAPMTDLADQPPAIGNAASTVTTLLGLLPQLNKNNPSFVKMESGKAVPAFGNPSRPFRPMNVKKEGKS